MAFDILNRHRVCLADHVDLICSFQLWFYFYLYMWIIHWGLIPEAVLEGLVCPCEARCGGSAAACVAGVLTALEGAELGDSS